MVRFWRRHVGITLTLVLLWLCPARVHGQEPVEEKSEWFTTVEVLERTQAKARTLKSLSGRFRQVKQNRLLNSPVESSGVFCWIPPERFRWEVIHPMPLVAIADGASLMLHYPDLHRARLFKHPSGESILGRVSGAAGNVQSLKEIYYVRVLPSSDDDGSRRVSLSLVPRSGRQDRHIKELKVTVDIATWLPERIEILAPSSDSTTLWLQDLAENRPLDESLFHMNVPEGVQLQRMDGSPQP